jgi:hypothetical protein
MRINFRSKLFDVSTEMPEGTRVFNRRDRQRWYLKLFKYIVPVAHEEVLAEVVAILKRTKGVSEVTLEPL